MSKWVSYLFLFPGLVMAIQVAFRFTPGSAENVGLSVLLVLIGMALLGMHQAQALRTSSRNTEHARKSEVNFVFVRMMATALIAVSFLALAMFVLKDKRFLTQDGLFWLSLPAMFAALTVHYMRIWRSVRILGGSGHSTEGVVTEVVRHSQEEHAPPSVIIRYAFEVPEQGSFKGQSSVPFTPLLVLQPGEAVTILYDPRNPAHNIMLHAWYGKSLQSKREYDKKLAHPDGDASFRGRQASDS